MPIPSPWISIGRAAPARPPSGNARPGLRRLWLAAPPLVAAGMVAGTLALGDRFRLEPPLPPAAPDSERIAAGLAPGGLTPPPPLPPSSFTHTGFPGLEGADRDWTRLDPAFGQSILALMARLADRGYPLALVEGYRSPERQAALAQSGRQVTRAEAYRSLHQYGLAADLAPLAEGVPVFSEATPWAREAYQALGEEAEALGLVWGGRWTLRDLGHVEVRLEDRSLLWRPQGPPAPVRELS